MEEEYIIASKTDIEKRIEDCDKGISLLQRVVNTSSGKQLEVTNTAIAKLYSEKNTLNSLLSQSTPLVPVLENAYFEGECYGIGTDACISKQDYISNLKLDI